MSTTIPHLTVHAEAEAHEARAEVPPVRPTYPHLVRPEPATAPEAVANSEAAPDHFIIEDGQEFAGRHILLDLKDATRLDDIQHVERALRDAVRAAGATLLHLHLHHFSPNGGVSGVAVLAESHISIHTWPERNFAALDIFMCGDAKPREAARVLTEAFTGQDADLREYKRGLM